MRAQHIPKERLVLTDIARSFRPKTLRKEIGLATTLLSAAALATTTWLRVFGWKHIAISAVEICAAVGVVGGISQSVGLIGLATIISLGLTLAGMIRTSPIVSAIILSP